MSFPFGSSSLTLDDITRKMRETFEGLADYRKNRNTIYTMIDAALSAFSVFFTQSPSFLEFQRILEESHGTNNATSLFGVHKIPSDNHIRNMLDSVNPNEFRPIFSYIFNGLESAGIIDSYRSVGGTLLLTFDGLEYFSSKAIHCEQCSTRKHLRGTVTYHHTALTPVIVKPGYDKVIPLAPEFVQPQDGAVKQDCELNAAKRWLAVYGKEFSQKRTTILGDDLYCHEPFCVEIIDLGFEFILVCKPSSHSTTYEWLEDFERNGTINEVIHTRWTGKRREIDTYRYVAAVPLRNANDALLVNWCEIVTTDENGKILYRNSFTTTFTINNNNVVEIVQAGRSRWKIENENNNTLKTKGYHFEHNYGHGKQHLSSVLASLIILAFLAHTVMEWMDDKFQLLRKKLPSRKRLFNDIKALTSYLCFESWDALMDFMLKGLDSPISISAFISTPKPETG